MTRKKTIAGNWKMHTTPGNGVVLAQQIYEGMKTRNNDKTEVIIIPPFTHISSIISTLGNESKIAVGAQNCHTDNEGAYTGEVSAYMLAEMGVKYIIIGHSERRQYFNETNDVLNKKLKAVLAHNITVIYCVGETLIQRENNEHFNVIEEQTTHGLRNISTDEMKKVILAYEPVWAIGTGKVATPAQAQEVHSFIRNLLVRLYAASLAEKTTILYGGSMKPDNATELLSQPDIDGGLIGGAALKAEQFLAIVDACL